MMTVRLSEIASVLRGITFPAAASQVTPFAGGIACLTTAAVKPQVDWESVRFIPMELVRSPQLLVMPDDILVSTTNSRDKVGTSVRIGTMPHEATFGAFVCLIRAGAQVASEYLALWLSSAEFFHQVGRRVTQTTGFANLTIADLLTVEIPLPPLSDQRRIAARLSDQLLAIDVIRNRTGGRASIARALRATLIDAPFEGPLVRSERRSIASVAQIQTGYAFRSEWFRGSGVRLLRNANVGHRRIDWSDAVRLDRTMEAQFEAFRLREGDIVLSLDRPLVSTGLKVARLTDSDVPSLLLQRVARLIPSVGVDPEYLFAFLLSSRFEESVSGHHQSVGVPHVSPRQVGAVELPVPNFGEQCRIAADLRERLAAVDAIDVSIQAAQKAVEALQTSVLRRAFGELAA